MLASLIAACGSNPQQRPTTYTVKRGDTLYAIAWRHGLDYRDVARWNGIGRNYLIRPGQVLRLYPTKVAARGSSTAHSPARPRSTPRATPAPRPNEKPVQWHWPVVGGTATLTSRPNGGHGLTISGRRGDPIHAAADGRVVYTGTGLLGYGQLVIVKHNETYLSAYGHTASVSVREGQQIKAGERIATMGAGPQGTPMLYFEIRRNGAPDNPLPLLPKR